MYIQHDEYFMMEALKEARAAYDDDEVPVGAVVVINNKIIARGYNQVEKLHDPTSHAEMIAITSACSFLGAKYLPDATLYVTIEPCHMCAGALYWTKLKRVVFGATDIKHGYQVFFGNINPFHPKTEITDNVLAGECSNLIKQFFKERR